MCIKNSYAKKLQSPQTKHIKTWHFINPLFSKCSNFLSSKENLLTNGIQEIRLAAYGKGGCARDRWEASTLIELFQNPKQIVHLSISTAGPAD